MEEGSTYPYLFWMNVAHEFVHIFQRINGQKFDKPGDAEIDPFNVVNNLFRLKGLPLMGQPTGVTSKSFRCIK